MKQGEILKSLAPRKDELARINRYTRRELAQEEVYTFSVVLCDNDIDRDFERFDEEALYTLRDLFIGKTGVFDHDPKAENQTARIYDCAVEQVPGKQTAAGDSYMRLVARAYLPRSKKNEDLILALDSGIQKEVSVGCAVSKNICSVCGADMRSGKCPHQKGKEYKGELCYAVLSGVTDAYEWSFVAVPAQRGAGVIKAWNIGATEEKHLQDITKALCTGGEVTLGVQEAKKLYEHICALEEDAQYGKAYREDLKKNVVRLSALVQPEVKKSVMEGLAGKMDLEELKAFCSAYEKKSAAMFPAAPQLCAVDGYREQAAGNADYNI